MSGNPPYLDVKVVEVILDVIRRANDRPDIQIVVIAVEEDCPPTVVSSIHPDQVPDVLTFCAEHHANAKVQAHMGSESGSLN